MNRARDQLFASPSLALNEHARIRGSNDGDELHRRFQNRAVTDDGSNLPANFFLQVQSLSRFFVSVLYGLFVLQRVLNRNCYLIGHLLEQNDVVVLKPIVRTSAEHQNPNHAATACERKITSGSQAFLDHALIKTLAVGVPKNF